MKKERTFKRPETLQKVLFLRLQGWPIQELGFLFGCEKTSVRKVCLKYGLPSEVPLLSRPIVQFKIVVLDFDGERINQGKDYKDYVKEAQRRKRQLQSNVV